MFKLTNNKEFHEASNKFILYEEKFKNKYLHKDLGKTLTPIIDEMINRCFWQSPLRPK